MMDLRLTKNLVARLPRLTNGRGGYQSSYRSIRAKVTTSGGSATVRVTEHELQRLRHWAGRNDAGSWQGWARDVLSHNRISW